MTRMRCPAIGIALLIVSLGSAFVADIISDWNTAATRPPPELKDVTIGLATTALLLLDIMKENCGVRPRCVAAVRAMKRLHDEARARNMVVWYSLVGSNGKAPPEEAMDSAIKPRAGEWYLPNGPDKFVLARGICATPLPPTRQLAQVAIADIGAVAVRLLEDPGRFAGKRFDLGGDELAGNDVVAILSRVTGRPFAYFQVPLDVIHQRMGEDGAKMYEWFDRVGYAVDRAALRREFPDVAFHDFGSWAKAQDWNTLLQAA